MKKIVNSELLHITNEDCMDLMSRYEDNYFDIAIVDPPYGINAGKMTMGKGSGNDSGKYKKKEWDKKPPSIEYFIELFRVSKNQIIWGSNHFLSNMPVKELSSSCWIVWDKKDYNSDFADAELAWTSFKSVVKVFLRSRSSGGDHLKRIHPTQKLVKLYEWILDNYAKSGDKILDTHLGSGSIAIACHKRSFELTGCEIDEDYFNQSIERINQEIKQVDIFQSIREISLEQGSLF